MVNQDKPQITAPVIGREKNTNCGALKVYTEPLKYLLEIILTKNNGKGNPVQQSYRQFASAKFQGQKCQ